MIVAKKTLLTLTLLITTIVMVYVARTAIVKALIKDELALYQTTIIDLDFHLTSDLNIAVNRLKLQTPQADIQIDNMTINVQLASANVIKNIDIASVTVMGTTRLLTPSKSTPNDIDNEISLAQLHAYLQQIAQLKFPADISVDKVQYFPYIIDNNGSTSAYTAPKKTRYLGRFSALNNTLALAIEDVQQNNVLTASFSKSKQNEPQFTLAFSSQLPALKRFMLAHELSISAAIADTLNTVETSGEYHGVLNYSAGRLTLDSQLKNFSLTSTEGAAASGILALSGVLDMHGHFDFNNRNQTIKSNAEVNVEFNNNTWLRLQISHQQLIDYLISHSVDPTLITLLQDNPVTALTFSPHGTHTYNLNNQQLLLSGIAITANSTQPERQLNVSDIALNLKHYLNNELNLDNNGNSNVNPKAKSHTPLMQLNFRLDSPLVLSAFNTYSNKPILFKLQGSISQKHDKTIITFDENSTLIVDNVVIAQQEKTAPYLPFTIKQIKTRLQGGLQIEENKNVTWNLKTESSAKNLRTSNIMAINSLVINSNFSGDFNNININADAIADNVPLGNLTVSGALDKPNIELAAKGIALTDLLALNIKLPNKIDLVDGLLDYNVTGHEIDLTNIQNTPFGLSLAMTDVSGEIAGIWIQELSWQQYFSFKDGNLSTQVNPALASGEDSDHNLTIALIDTPTPISNLSISTAWHYEKDFKIAASKLKGDILGGSFAIPEIQWPLKHGHSVNVQLTSIDLEQVLALDKKQGIVVTGKISGQLPIQYDGEKYTMENGELHNVSNGLIQVINNPTVQELKASNTQLQLAFDALQNLHYHQLSSDVSMADDGYMLLQTVIKGRNPDIDNDVNLNLNLSYDLLGLLESMSITEQFEDRIIKGLQKNKE